MEKQVTSQNPADTNQTKTQEESVTIVSPTQAVVKNDGDCKEETQKKDKSAAIEETTSDESRFTKNEPSELTPSQILNDKKDNQVDEPESELNENISTKNNSDNHFGDASEERRDKPESTTQDTQQLDDHGNDVENIGSTTPEASQTEERQVTSDESRVTKNEPSELTPSQIPNDKKDNQVDEPEPELNENISTKNNSDNQFGDASEERREEPESTTQDTQLDDHSNDVENIGPTTQEASQTEERQVTSGSGKCWLAVAIRVVIAVAIVAIVLQHFLQPESPPQTNDVRHIDVFLRQLEKVKTRFPNQRAELWNRGRIHLKRHLQTTQPTEPVSLILTAGLRAEKTLSCIARDLASAFSSARNASVLHIDGASKASQDSDQVKLDIDRKLQAAFEGDKPVAVIHRFEELPPGSTLVFYRYCDHENAAYKNTFLIFTVLLGEEDEIPAKISLCAVEEMVDDHLQKKFLTHGQPVSFDSTVHHIFPGPYLEKYGGLWSRISHLILPVAAEERIELEGC